MSLINKLKNWLVGESYYAVEKTGLHKKQEIIQTVIHQLRHLIGLSKVRYSHLILFVKTTSPADDIAVGAVVNQDNFVRELDIALKNAQIQLPANWIFEARVSASLPEHLPATSDGRYALEIKQAQPAPLAIKTRIGQTKEDITFLVDFEKRYNLGRGATVQLDSGGVISNDIIFMNPEDAGYDSAQGAPNARVSRHHAYIQYDPDSNHFMLFPYRGGLPVNGNRTKILRKDLAPISLREPGYGEILYVSDQILLGNDVILEVLPATPSHPDTVYTNPG